MLRHRKKVKIAGLKEEDLSQALENERGFFDI